LKYLVLHPGEDRDYLPGPPLLRPLQQEVEPRVVFFISPQSRDVARLRRKAIGEGTHLDLEVALSTS